jgi:phage gp36-like protein
MPAIPTNLLATVDDFVAKFGETEAVELTNLEYAEGNAIDYAKLAGALASALATCRGFDAMSQLAGKVLIRLNLRTYMLHIARFQLDTISTRPDVLREYERCLELMQSAMRNELTGASVDQDVLEELGLVEAPADKFIVSPGTMGFTLPPTGHQFYL